MAYDENLAERLRDAFASESDVVEKKMFGGLAFMVRGHMTCGIAGDALMVRVGPDGHAAALRRPHARPMDFTGKPIRGLVLVDPDGWVGESDLAGWVATALAFTKGLPRK
ncbi:MAG: TfoX/Sxy family protein [Planctomycetota bacterium]